VVVVHVRVGDIVWVAVYRGSGSSRGYRVSFVVSIGVVGEGVVEVSLGGRGGIAVVVVRVGVVEAVVGVDDRILEGIGIEVRLRIGIVVLGINVKDGRGRGA